MSQLIETACSAADRGWFDAAQQSIAAVPESARERSAALSLLASIHRQLGAHDVARVHDLQGCSGAAADPLGVAMCRIGLAADLVGAADAEGAERTLRGADSDLAGLSPSHWAVRWFDPWLTRAWVEAEIALLSDEPARAAALLEPFLLPRSGQANTRAAHERAKTLLFLGIAERTAGQPEPAHEHLRQAARTAARADLAPLLIPIAEAMALAEPERAATWDTVATRARSRIAAHLPTG